MYCCVSNGLVIHLIKNLFGHSELLIEIISIWRSSSLIEWQQSSARTSFVTIVAPIFFINF